MISYSAVTAVAKRQLGSFLANPIGYIFILAFIVLTGVISFWSDDFFKRNIADLGLAQTAMPYLLAILVPALSMTSWTQEKENGTDELLLTLPVTVAEAVLGKFLAISAFFTIALICNGCNILVLAWIGEPDLGLLAANYIGWWLYGMVFIGFSLWASVIAPSTAVAFVYGVLFCFAICFAGEISLEWSLPFTRGIISIGNAVIALCLIIIGLVLSVIALASQRWQVSQRGRIALQIVNTLMAIWIAINCGWIAHRHYVGFDMSSDGLSSLSTASSNIVEDLEGQTKITLFISQDVPDELQHKAKEVMDTCAALERSSGGQVKIVTYRPADAYDELGTRATDNYGIAPRSILTETVAGREPVDVFLGAVITRGSEKQRIPFFDPGLSVEYELVSSLRSVNDSADGKLPVLGVVVTEIEMMDRFDYGSGRTIPAWQVVEEWRKQYIVQEVYPDTPIGDDIDILVVPALSGLQQEQMTYVHDYIWAGRPALIMVDPFPYIEITSKGNAVAPSLKLKAQQRNQEEQLYKGDIASFFDALGLDCDLTEIAWNDYAPSDTFRNLPKNFVWSSKRMGAIPDTPVTGDMDLLLTVFPAALHPAKKTHGLTHTPLLTLNNDPKWGLSRFSDYLVEHPYFGLQPNPNPPIYRPEMLRDQPWLAVEVKGLMPRAYDSLEVVEEELAADGEENAAAEKKSVPVHKKGEPSQKPIHVIVLGDTDLAQDDFFSLYRSIDARNSQADQQLLGSIRNIQFLSNVVDALADNSDFMQLRTRRIKHRTLTRMEEVRLFADAIVSDAQDKARIEFEEAQREAQGVFDKKLNAIKEREDLDETSKANLVADAEIKGRRDLEAKMVKIEEQRQKTVLRAKAEQRHLISQDRRLVKIFAIGIPAAFMLCLIITVSFMRFLREQTNVPTARSRKGGAS